MITNKPIFFDKQFSSAETNVIPEAAAFEAFGGSGGYPPSASLGFGGGADSGFGFGDPTGQGFGDSFGMPPVPNSTPAVPRRHDDPPGYADANNPFLADGGGAAGLPGPGAGKSTEAGETPETPLFDTDVSRPLEPIPRLGYAGDGWEMFIRHPPKKKITSQRYTRERIICQ